MSESSKKPETQEKKEDADDAQKDVIVALDDSDISILKTYVCSIVTVAFFCFAEGLASFVLQGQGPYSAQIKAAETDIQKIAKKVNEICGAHNSWPSVLVLAAMAIVRRLTWFFLASGVKETDTGLAPPSMWDLNADKQMMQEDQPLQARPGFVRARPFFLFVWTVLIDG